LGRKKIERFEYNLLATNVLEEGKALYEIIKGNWNKSFFKNDNPIVLELACGKGEYTVGLAKQFPDKNLIGIDVKGDRIAVGSKKSFDLNLSNVAFLRTDIYFLTNFFVLNEVSEIWITFPDPFNVKLGRENRRLTHTHFLEFYKEILKPEGLLHLKTDNLDFFEYSINELLTFGATNLQSTTDLYKSPFVGIHHGIQTKFEQIFTKKGFLINYLQCNLL
jgi:tRNA (guanine-N7-)-methyltransferase